MYFYLYIQERLKTKEFLTPTISQLHHYSNWMNVKMQGSSNFESLFKGTSHLQRVCKVTVHPHLILHFL